MNKMFVLLFSLICTDETPLNMQFMSFVSIKYRFLICFMKYSDDITSNTLSSPSCWMMVYKKELN